MSPNRPRSHPAAALLLVLLTAAVLVAGGVASPGLTTPSTAATPPAPSSGPAWGLYSGPGAKGETGARRFAGDNDVTISRVLDFLPSQSWKAMEQSDWLIKAHQGSAYHLELSVPMVPDDNTSSLEGCAAGAYDKTWSLIARKLQAAGLGSSTIRPGWEANGTWYPWSARGKENAYIGCFRRIVSAMRREAGALDFSWSMSNGTNAVRAETLWPGESFVDVVGVDVYDYDWYHYPHRKGTSVSSARAGAWEATVGGTRGLRYWSGFAAQHRKPLALSEWGLAWRSDGHAGGDNTTFAKGMVAFVRSAENHVAYATYFNNADTSRVAHRITGKSRFPVARREVLKAMRS